MNARLNRILDSEQITQILATLLTNRPIKILKVIVRTGRQQSSVPWVYYVNEITGDRYATFVSFQDLLASFWVWLSTVELMAITMFKRQAISRVVWNYVREGDIVYSLKHGWASVVDKDETIHENVPRLWLELDKNSRIEIEEPCFVEIF